MRTWKNAVVLVALFAGTVAGPLAPAARASTATDLCGDTADAEKDLASATFTYSASSFSVGTTACADLGVHGNWAITFHLTGFSPEVQVTAAFQDVGKYEGYSGYYVCTNACDIHTDGAGALVPSGRPIDGPAYPPTLYSAGRTSLAYGAWSDVLPSGTAVPDVMPWYAEVHGVDSYGGTLESLDRAPDLGNVDEKRNASPTASRLDVRPGPAPWRGSQLARRTDTGLLHSDSGDPIVDRLVQITPYPGPRTASDDNGRWSTDYWIGSNTKVTAYFPGDGVHEPARAAYIALVKAFVSLDLPASKTVRRGTPLVLRGVVRPHAAGQVRVLIREDRSGATYRLLRYTNLIQNGDSYYRTSWSPTVRGRYVLRTVWNGGSPALGAALSNISTYRFVTVT